MNGICVVDAERRRFGEGSELLLVFARRGLGFLERRHLRDVSHETDNLTCDPIRDVVRETVPTHTTWADDQTLESLWFAPESGADVRLIARKQFRPQQISD